MTGTNCDLFTHKSSRSYLNHLVHTYRLFSVAAVLHQRGSTKVRLLKVRLLYTSTIYRRDIFLNEQGITSNRFQVFESGDQDRKIDNVYLLAVVVRQSQGSQRCTYRVKLLFKTCNK